MKTTQEWAEEIRDEALLPYCTCEHFADADEHGTRVNVSYDLEDNGLLRIMEIIHAIREDFLNGHFHAPKPGEDEWTTGK